MEERAKRFASLFRGSPRGHGTYTVQSQGAAAGEKVEGQRWTVHEPAGESHFVRHLAGSYGLGAVPLLLEPAGTTRWAAIDIDVYKDFDLPTFAVAVATLRFPLVVCRSKSGGAHCYIFFDEPISATLVRITLHEWTKVLRKLAKVPKGKDIEVFPKQDALTNDSAQENSFYGNWINLPYQAGDRSTRYAFSPDGTALTLDEFLTTAELSAVTHDEFIAFVPGEEEDDSTPEENAMFPGAPPCLVRMAIEGIIEGGRNRALFAAAIYYKRADVLHLRERVEAFNEQYIKPPLAPFDVAVTIRSAQKKDYNYQCKEAPLVTFCDHGTCVKRAFGVAFGRKETSGTFSDLRVGPLLQIRTEPTTWRWQINESVIDFTTEELMNQKAFLIRVAGNTSPPATPRPLKTRGWEDFWRGAMAVATTEIPPEDATSVGQLLFHLNAFCTGRARAKLLEEILLHKPYFDEEKQLECFTITDFLAYLLQQRVMGATERTVYLKLTDRGLQPACAVLKGKLTNYWTIPRLAIQTQEFDVPKTEEDIPF